MCKNHFILHDIRIVDWVQEYSKITNKYSNPMYVSAIFNDGTIYLDFDGNEGDVWEASIEDIRPIKITRETLELFGFEYINQIEGFRMCIGEGCIYVYDIFNTGRYLFSIDDYPIMPQVCSFIHELQHKYYEYMKKPLILKLRSI